MDEEQLIYEVELRNYLYDRFVFYYENLHKVASSWSDNANQFENFVTSFSAQDTITPLGLY